MALTFIMLMGMTSVSSTDYIVSSGDDLQSTIDSAEEGSTIIINSSGSSFKVDEITINKSINIKGINDTAKSWIRANDLDISTGFIITADNVNISNILLYRFNNSIMSNGSNLILNNFQVEGSISADISGTNVIIQDSSFAADIINLNLNNSKVIDVLLTDGQRSENITIIGENLFIDSYTILTKNLNLKGRNLTLKDGYIQSQYTNFDVDELEINKTYFYTDYNINIYGNNSLIEGSIFFMSAMGLINLYGNNITMNYNGILIRQAAGVKNLINFGDNNNVNMNWWGKNNPNDAVLDNSASKNINFTNWYMWTATVIDENNSYKMNISFKPSSEDIQNENYKFNNLFEGFSLNIEYAMVPDNYSDKYHDFYGDNTLNKTSITIGNFTDYYITNYLNLTEGYLNFLGYMVVRDGKIVGFVLNETFQRNFLNETLPKIGTSAINNNTGDRTGISDGIITIVDTVNYWNLNTSQIYVINGFLMYQNGSHVIYNGHKVNDTYRFTPIFKNGTVQLTFVFDATDFGNVSVVVFEYLYYDNNTHVANHTDINDPNQTVTLKEPPKPDIPSIGTSASNNATGNKTIVSDGIITIVDNVVYWNLVAGENYTVTGVLMNKTSGKPILINGKNVTSSKTFTVKTVNGSVLIYFTFDATDLGNISVVVFEELFDINGTLIAEHKDINDTNQTVTFEEPPKPDIPSIGTSAKDKITGDKTIVAKGIVTIVDTVTYTNLIVGKVYTVSGILMDKSTGKALLINGKTIIANKTFTATSANGTIDLEFTFDASSLQGKIIVVFEKLYQNGTEIAVHEDINDKEQTIEFLVDDPDEPEIPEIPNEPVEDIDELNEKLAETEMKSTGNPILLLILVLLSIVSIRRTKK
ncbi:VaFE repeat-containing surface-anchored protein [Methanobrevibacter sp. DSM 116169]|uniref:VaFE repeat-containing surface-anchored protein n=1 Tax=Methanobrevibacter sp. DSM 116169 TaxID=3242727 RepID=UPI0038FD00CD